MKTTTIRLFIGLFWEP